MAPHRALLAIAVFCASLIAAHARSPDANCDLLFDGESLSESIWKGFLNVSKYVGNLLDDRPPGDYLTLSTDQVTGVAPNPESKYIDVQLDTAANTLKLVINSNFATYEEDMISSTDASSFDVTITLTCSDGNSPGFRFRITVEDVNNHAPVFQSPSFEYEMPMPLPSGFNLSCIIDVIQVTDIDFTNSLITVEFDPEGAQLFEAKAIYQGSRSYAVSILSRTAVELKETTSFTMTAVDNGNPQKSSEPTAITIKVNQETSVPTAPKFEQPALHQTVRAEDIMPGNQIASVTISEGYDSDVKVTYDTLHDEGLTPSSDKFTVAVKDGGSADTATVILSWADGVKSEDIVDLKYALIVVEATRERGLSTTQTTTTVIHLSLPGLEDQPTTACPTAEPTTQCPEPEPCTTAAPETTTQCPEPEPCTTAAPETTTQCPEPEPCVCTTSTAEPTTPCPEPDPCNCTTATPTTTTPDASSSSTTVESTTNPTSSSTDPTWPTAPYPSCDSSDDTEPCICPAPSQCTAVETTSPGCPTDCSQCTTTEGPPTSPDTGSPTVSTEFPTSSPTSSPTSPDTGSPTDPIECPGCTTSSPTISPTSPDTGSPTDYTDCPGCTTSSPTSSPTSPETGSPPTSSPTSDDTDSPTDSTECPGCTTSPPTSSVTSPTTGSPTGSTECPVCPTTCTPCEPCPTGAPTSTTTALPPGPEIEFESPRYSLTVASDYKGDLLDLRLKDSAAAEGFELACQVDAAGDVSSWVVATAEGNSGCRLSTDVSLPAGAYSLAVVGTLVGTSSSATAQVALGVTAAVWCNASSSAGFSHALQVASLPENPAAPQTVVPPTQLPEGARCSFTVSVDPARYSEWVTVDGTTGEVSVTDLDYEQVASLLIWLSVSCDPDQQQQLRAARDLPRKDQPDWPRELLFDVTKMSVMLQIEDLNDNPPVFTAGDRLVVGYPTGDLLERVQPGPVVTLTATDADEGENAELRYGLDAAGGQLFAVQPRTGAVYLRADAAGLPAGGAAFTATVADLAGAQGARTDSLQVQVVPLEREELVLMMTVGGALPEDADAVVANLSSATGLSVRLLRAYAATSGGAGAASAGGARAGADAGAALTLLLYALDDQEALVTVQAFQEILSSSEVDLPWEVSKVENLPPEAEQQEPADVTGYMAAIIALAVLIAVAVVAVGAGYYFYFRPRMGIQKKKDGYTEFTSAADKPSPLESQIPQISTTVEPNISTVSEIIEPVNKLTVDNNIQSNGVLAPVSDDDWQRKRSMTIRGGPDDYDIEAHREGRRSESSDSLDGDGAQAESEQRKSSLDEDEANAEAERRKSTVHFNENVECIEVERL